MGESGFVDYYELLQLSSNADSDTIERVFRHLAKKFHPDCANSVDNGRFNQILEAYRTLTDPEARAGYDVRYQDYWNHRWGIASEASDEASFENDLEIRENILTILYIKRRRDMKCPGMGEHEIARLMGRPVELVEFHVWYLKSKGWVERLDSGQLAISALGVDQVEQGRFRLGNDHLITGPERAERPAAAGSGRTN